jgi:hypothetical protein
LHVADVVKGELAIDLARLSREPEVDAIRAHHQQTVFRGGELAYDQGRPQAQASTATVREAT